MRYPETTIFRDKYTAIILMASIAMSGCTESERDKQGPKPIAISLDMVETADVSGDESDDGNNSTIDEETKIKIEESTDDQIDDLAKPDQDHESKAEEIDKQINDKLNQPSEKPLVYSTAMSFNLLGFSHTAPPDGKKYGKGYDNGRERYIDAVQWMYDHGVEVASLQERQKQQLMQHLSNKRTLKLNKEDGGGKIKIKERFGVYPAESFGLSSQTAVIWDKTRYEFVSGRMVKGHEYFHGADRSFPEATLRDKITEVEITIRAIHDPADVRGNAQRFRNDNQIDHREALEAAVIEDENLMIIGDFNQGLSADAKIAKPDGVSNVCSIDDQCKLREDARSIDKAFVANDENFVVKNFRTTKGPNNQRITDHPKLPIFKFAVVEEQ